MKLQKVIENCYLQQRLMWRCNQWKIPWFQQIICPEMVNHHILFYSMISQSKHDRIDEIKNTNRVLNDYITISTGFSKFVFHCTQMVAGFSKFPRRLEWPRSWTSFWRFLLWLVRHINEGSVIVADRDKQDSRCMANRGVLGACGAMSSGSVESLSHWVG